MDSLERVGERIGAPLPVWGEGKRERRGARARNQRAGGALARRNEGDERVFDGAVGCRAGTGPELAS